MKYAIGFLVFFICFGLGIWFYSDSSEAAQKALNEFYTCNCMFDNITEPLWNAGDKVVPLVIEKVKDKNMPRRMYAIEFLGGKKSSQAVPVLEQIIKDETEDNYHRKKALWSVFQINENTAKTLAQEYKSNDDYLGNYANCILTEKFCF